MEQIEKITRDQVRNKVLDFIKNNFLMGRDVGELGDGDSFLEKGIVDSTGILELVSFIEQEFNFKVGDEELMPENFDSLNNITNFVIKKVGK